VSSLRYGMEAKQQGQMDVFSIIRIPKREHVCDGQVAEPRVERGQEVETVLYSFSDEKVPECAQ
jgi:hypothetical protein